jgi:hypothetical protein
MIMIAHRGLTDGPDVNLENRPEQIELTLSKGIDCEIDVWRIKDEWFLGHDRPDYKVDDEFLSKRGLWLHCKNLDALLELSSLNYNEYFWHQEDDYTLTSSHYIWTYPGKELTRNSIAVQPEARDDWWIWTKNCKNIAGVCTKYVYQFLDENCTVPVRSATKL